MKFKATIRGLCPLLMHRFSEDSLTTPTKKTGDKKLTDDEKRTVAKEYLYLEKGKLSQPAIHIESTMQKASTQFKMAGNGKKTYKELVKGGVFVFPDMIPHKYQKWEVDSRAVVNPSTGGRKMCYRPCLDKWELEFELQVNDDRADAEVIKQMLEHAGAYIGIGSYRPRFGRFEVVSFKEAK